MKTVRQTAVALVVLAVAGVLGVGSLLLAAEGNGTKTDIIQAAAEGRVAYRVFASASLSEVIMELRNRTDLQVIVVVLPGTVFDGGEDVQRMGVTRGVTVALPPGETRRVTVTTACLDMEREQPDDGTEYAKIYGPLSVVSQLCASAAFQGASMRVQQFALWTVLSRPSDRNSYAGLGLGADAVQALLAIGLPMEVLMALYVDPDEVYALSSEETAVLAMVFTVAGIPVESADDLLVLFSSGGPTAGEVAQVRQVLRGAGFALDQYPSLA